MIEVSFLYNFHSKLKLWACPLLCLVYTMGVCLMSAVVLLREDEMIVYPPHLSFSFAVIGVVTFLFGELGNGYHHYLLARLRRGNIGGCHKCTPPKKRQRRREKYKLPVGGLFSLVCCPHYLFEIISWLGICLVVNHTAIYLWTLLSFSIFLGRSGATLRWYRSRTFDKPIPSTWYAMIPYLW